MGELLHLCGLFPSSVQKQIRGEGIREIIGTHSLPEVEVRCMVIELQKIDSQRFAPDDGRVLQGSKENLTNDNFLLQTLDAYPEFEVLDFTAWSPWAVLLNGACLPGASCSFLQSLQDARQLTAM